MAHAQKRDFVFRRNGRVHLIRRGRQSSRLLAAEVCASAVVMLGIPCSVVVWKVLATHSFGQFPLHFPSRASPCAITFQLDSTIFYMIYWYTGRVWTSRLLSSLWLCRAEGFGLLLAEVCDHIATLLSLNKNIRWSFRPYINRTAALCFTRSGPEASPSCARRQFLTDTRAMKLKGKTGTIIKNCLINECQTQQM
jgi:hypothetical protein